MTSAHASFKRGKVAFALGAMMLIAATTIPFATVFADNQQGADDLVVVVEPRLGTLMGSGIAVASTGNMFIFEFELFHASGQPFLVSEIMVDAHTIDGRADPNAQYPTLVYSELESVSPPSNKGVIRIPANEIIFYTPADPNGYDHEFPFGGISLTVLATRDEFGNPLLDANGHYPAGQHSLLANQLAEEGNFAEADLADEGFTPIFLFNGQLSGLTQFGNPILNPGFEIGYDSAGPDPVPPVPGFTTAIPPWFMLTNTGDKPASGHHIQGACGVSGSCGAVRYNTADNGKGVHFGQLFFIPGANSPGPWYGSPSVKAVFDIRARDEAGLISSFHSLATLHWNDSAEPDGDAQLTRGPVAGIPTDNQWRRIELDFGNVANDSQLNSFFFSFNLDATTAPAGSKLVVEIDNVRLKGVMLSPEAVNPMNDLTDGYAAFTIPAAAKVNAEEQVSQALVQLADGELGYVYRVKAMDYTGIDPQSVDVANGGYTIFAMLDEEYLPDMSRDPSDVPYFAATNGLNSDAFFQFVESDGSLSEDLLVVVPASFAGDSLVPWVFNDVAVGDTYANTYGDLSEPVSGYHSVLRNNLMFTHLADSLDYAFTPIQLVDIVGSSMASSTSILLECLGQASNVMCSADPNPDLKVTIGTASPILEDMTVEIVANGNVNETIFPGKVLGTATIPTPGGSAVITLSNAAMAELLSPTVGDARVFARVLPGVFAEGAETPLFELDNFAPIASFTNTSLSSLFKGSTATFTSTSTDSDGVIAHNSWTVEYLGDTSPDADNFPTGLYRASNASSITITIPEDGDFKVRLEVIDDGGATDASEMLFSAGNRLPQISISGPSFVPLNTTAVFRYVVTDIDGQLAQPHHTNNGTGNVPCSTLMCPIVTSFATEGIHTVSVTASDDDGASVTQTFNVLVDGVGPATVISSPPAPVDTGGWFLEPVSFTVNRSDPVSNGVASGVASTTIVVDGVAETVSGSANVTRTLETDGEHLIVATSVDRAGNNGTAVTKTIKIDRSKPTVAISTPALVDGAPISGVYVTDQVVEIAVNADDDHSPISKVELFIDGGEAADVAIAPGTDGLYHFTWTAAGTGMHEIVVLATNAAGLREISDTITILVI